jgi:hypothetical protein
MNGADVPGMGLGLTPPIVCGVTIAVGGLVGSVGLVGGWPKGVPVPIVGGVGLLPNDGGMEPNGGVGVGEPPVGAVGIAPGGMSHVGVGAEPRNPGGSKFDIGAGD